jgi:SAM-dependent methyltransferase
MGGAMSTIEAPRSHDELAPWWPLISPVEAAAEEARTYAGLLRSGSIPVREVLELGSGAGHRAVHLAPWFDLTLVDASPAMVEQSRRLNPRSEHVVADLRAVRLDRCYDAVLLHDTAGACTSVADVAAAVATASVHLRPGGVAVVVPEHTVETFTPGTEHGGVDGADGRAVRTLRWTHDRNPGDEVVDSDWVFVLRHADGTVRTVHEAIRTGCFHRATWLTALVGAGLEARRVTEPSTADGGGRDVFVGRRPG